MRSFHLFSGLVLLFMVSSFGCDAAPNKIPPQVYRRTAFLGDSITDGNTYPSFVREALMNARLPGMVAINAGIGGDTAKGMRARLERDVLAYKPTLVTLSVGANDSLQGVSPEAYEADVRAIAAKLKQEGVPLILLTPNLMGARLQSKGGAVLTAYEVALRRIAADYGLRVAEVNRRQSADLAGGQPQLTADGVHPNYEGQRMIARATLDAMGYEAVPVPARIHNKPLPGVIGDWKFRVVDPKEGPLTASTVAQVKPDAHWTSYDLPEEEALAADPSGADTWLDDYRAQGMGVSLNKKVGDGTGSQFLGYAVLKAKRPGPMQFHTGADLRALWLNGKQIYHAEGFRGWHPGRESVTADLVKGNNVIVIETGAIFFLSATDKSFWPLTEK